jgi:hypothetical protein
MASGFDISVRADIKALAKSLDNLAYKQLPYATALALSSVAYRVVTAEREALSSVLKKKPTPFTTHAFRFVKATKSSLTATVYALPVQAAYLAPSETGGMQILGRGRRIRTPVDVKTNTCGNISKGQIAKLLQNPNNFMGVVKGINGIWARPQRGQRRNQNGYGTKGQLNKVAGFNTTLKLLVAFTQPVAVSPHLDYQRRAQQIVQQNISSEFSKAMSQAIDTAKPS